MSEYEALARRYRPQTFDDVLSQPQVTQTLKNAIGMGRIHHAYLFCGPRGTGKTTTARILAKALNCEQGPTATPCNACPSCVGITNGSHIDVREIDAASHTGVDDIRELRDSTQYVPAMSRFKIYIIDEIHRLSPNAKDALLKTLEEPPPSVKFIFATTEPHEVPATIRSRALRFDFHLVTHDVLRDQLRRIAGQEGLSIDADSLDIIAAEAAGSVRDSQSLLDQIASYADGAITAPITNEALGLVDTEALFAFSDAVAASDAAGAIDVVGRVSRGGRDYGQFVRQLNEHFKRLLFARTLRERFADPGLGEETRTRYAESAKILSENDWLRALLMSVETGRSLRYSPQPRLEMELFALRVSQMDRSVDIKSLLDRIGRQIGAPDLFGSSPSTPRPNGPTPATPPNPAPMQRPTVPAPRMETRPTPAPEPSDAYHGSNGRLDFEPILHEICRHRPTLRAILGAAELMRTEGGVELNVYNGSTFHQRQLGQKPVRDLIHTEIARALGEGIKVVVHVKEGPSPHSGLADDAATAGPTTPDDPARLRRDTENEHLLQEIIRRFDGEIVE